MSRKLEEKQRRRLAEEQRKAEERKAHRRRNLVTLGIALAVGVGVVLLIINEREVESGPLGVAASEAGCTEIETATGELSQDHVEGDVQVTYEESPPVGGEHWPPGFQADPGFYSETLDEERLVHNLEHGQIVIWYRPDSSDETLNTLEEFIDRENSATDAPVAPLLAVPYDDVDQSSSYVMTAWGASQSCAKMSSEAIDDFRVRYQGRGPEQVVPPFAKPE
jgi:hypothetical protein